MNTRAETDIQQSSTSSPQNSTDADDDAINDNPKLGVLWYIVYTLKMTAILYITKALYGLNPDIEVLQVTMMKALISIGILIVMLNIKLKHVMYDTIDPESKWALAFKSVQTCVSIFI